MKLKGIPVSHKVFGSGTIKQQLGQHITCTFLSGDKKFMYNSSLKNFVTVLDKDANTFIQNEIDQNAIIKSQMGRKAIY